MDPIQGSRIAHAVQFFHDDEHLLDRIVEHLEPAIRFGGGALVIATTPHRQAAESMLRERGADTASASAEGRYVFLEAAAHTSQQFIVDGWPDALRFENLITGSLTGIRRHATPHGAVRVFTELPAILWAEGKRDCAMRVEQLWNDLAQSGSFELLCAYPMSVFGPRPDARFDEVAAVHSLVHWAEAVDPVPDQATRRLMIADLEQRTAALENEVARRKLLEEALRQQIDELATVDRMKDRFLATLAHELRTPLAGILSGSQVLVRRAGFDDRAKRAADVVERQARHLSRLVDDLLDAARLQTGRVVLQPRACDLREATQRALQMVQARGRGRSHRVAIDFPSEPLLVRADPVRLEQVLTNLLDNAFKYTPEDGTVSVAAKGDGGSAVLRVRDSGVGIDPALLPVLFEPFTQSPSTVGRSEGGLGLGLAIVRGLVLQHGGQVYAHSDGPGRGSEITVHWPLAESDRAFDVRRPTPARHLRVALIEDNEDARIALRDLLELEGYAVQTAADGQSGLDLILRSRPDVALVDIGLPVIDGYMSPRRCDLLSAQVCDSLRSLGTARSKIASEPARRVSVAT